MQKFFQNISNLKTKIRQENENTDCVYFRIKARSKARTSSTAKSVHLPVLKKRQKRDLLVAVAVAEVTAAVSETASVSFSFHWASVY